MAEIKMYAVAVNTDEMYEDIGRHGGTKSKEMMKRVNPPAVYPGDDFTAFLFATLAERNKAYDALKHIYETAAIMPQPALVDERYLKQVD